MLDYCDPPTGLAEWRERRESWTYPHSSELRAKRALVATLTRVRAKLSYSHASNSTATKVESIEELFNALVMAWREATENLSSLTQIVSHPSYQRIIDLGQRGEPVVPLILRDLRSTGGHWAMALNAITGENPVNAKHIGNSMKVREDWIAWGRHRGYL